MPWNELSLEKVSSKLAELNNFVNTTANMSIFSLLMLASLLVEFK
jgi:hypothetical protein